MSFAKRHFSTLRACVVSFACFMSAATVFSVAPAQAADPTPVLVTRAPAPNEMSAKGVRLNAGVSDVLFRSYESSLGPMFITNVGPNSYFIPQNKEAEFKSFIKAVQTPPGLVGITINAAVKPTSPVIDPAEAGPPCGISPWNPKVIRNLPFPYQEYEVTASDIVVERYTKATPAQAALPSSHEKVSGSLDLSSPWKFTAILSPNPTSPLCGHVTYTKVYKFTLPSSSAGIYTESGIQKLEWSKPDAGGTKKKIFVSADGIPAASEPLIEVSNVCEIPEALKKWGCHMDGLTTGPPCDKKTGKCTIYPFSSTTYSWTCAAGCTAACPPFSGGGGIGLHNRYCVSKVP